MCVCACLEKSARRKSSFSSTRLRSLVPRHPRLRFLASLSALLLTKPYFLVKTFAPRVKKTFGFMLRELSITGFFYPPHFRTLTFVGSFTFFFNTKALRDRIHALLSNPYCIPFHLSVLLYCSHLSPSTFASSFYDQCRISPTLFVHRPNVFSWLPVGTGTQFSLSVRA